jgi:hypothetical protein
VERSGYRPAAMADDGGVMGNLPRSRPGTRSAKRTSDSSPAAGTRKTQSSARKPAGSGRKPASGAARKPASAAARKPQQRRRTAPPRAAEPRPAATPQSSDPFGEVVKLGVKVAGAGLGVAAGVLRRLPRP